MISSLDPSYLAFLNAMDAIQQREQTDQTQLSTGLRINQISDAPGQLNSLFNTQSQIAQLDQVNSNLKLVQTETSAADSALQSATQILDQVQSLATQAEPTSTSASTRTTISQQVGDALTNLVHLANTAVNGRYIFSGDSDQTQPYTIDLTQANPVSAYAGSASTRQIALPDGSQIPVALTAQQIFDSSNAQTNVFNAVNSLRTALQNNDQAGIDSAISTLASASQYLNQQLAQYGGIENQLTNAATAGQTMSTQLQTQLANIQDADLSKAIVDLNQTALQQQAALGAEAKMPQQSLFNYLG